MATSDDRPTLGLEQLQRRVDDYIQEHGVRYFDALTNMAILAEEVGEVGRIMARQYGEQSAKAGEALHLADELADVLFVVCCLANQTGVDLEAAMAQNLVKKEGRDAHRHRGNAKLKPSADDQRQEP